ncbi:uncharacterized protein LOC131859135 [Cryptomeria japonica]|uniref:uncharacterized protein LOC131859135 n=1 Tax=Cryptomeria japonica TaxID=3369 RepID=UPI0027DA4FA5|nr:uncharacterized protein LOC131859135 [Cryptomeria japonica]
MGINEYDMGSVGSVEVASAEIVSVVNTAMGSHIVAAANGDIEVIATADGVARMTGLVDEKKKSVWQEIEQFLRMQEESHIITGGDFNKILYATDKSSGNTNMKQSQRDFVNWINNNNLFGIATKTGFHTWNNRRKDFTNIAETLDRFFFKGDLTEFHRELKTMVLPWSRSDHFPVLLELMGETEKMGYLFKFERMWFTYEEFLPNIQKWWKDSNVVGSKLFCLVSKMKEIKHNLLD